MANQKRKCRHCKGYFDSAQMVIVPLGAFCSMAHVTEHGLQKAQKARHKQNKKELTKYRERTKTASQWKVEAQAAFNAYVRYRDRNRRCVSCSSILRYRAAGGTDAGHYRSRGAAAHLAFNLHNCHGQCVHCNRYLSGNVVEYRKVLEKRIGKRKLKKLENNNEVRRFDIEYYKRIKKVFTKKLRVKKKMNNC